MAIDIDFDTTGLVFDFDDVNDAAYAFIQRTKTAQEFGYCYSIINVDQEWTELHSKVSRYSSVSNRLVFLRVVRSAIRHRFDECNVEKRRQYLRGRENARLDLSDELSERIRLAESLLLACGDIPVCTPDDLDSILLQKGFNEGMQYLVAIELIFTDHWSRHAMFPTGLPDELQAWTAAERKSLKQLVKSYQTLIDTKAQVMPNVLPRHLTFFRNLEDLERLLDTMLSHGLIRGDGALFLLNNFSLSKAQEIPDSMTAKYEDRANEANDWGDKTKLIWWGSKSELAGIFLYLAIKKWIDFSVKEHRKIFVEMYVRLGDKVNEPQLYSFENFDYSYRRFRTNHSRIKGIGNLDTVIHDLELRVSKQP